MQRIRANRFGRIILELLPLFIVIVCTVLDQITKTCFKNLYFEKGGSTQVIKNFFYLTYTVNTGAAWSFLADVSWGQTFFKILTAVSLVLFVLFYIYAFKRNYKWLKYSIAIVVGGTLGNFIDRLSFNGVTDFISLVFGDYYFPVFNLADSFLTVGVIMLIVHFLFLDESALFKKNNGKENDSNR
ncbi:MAG: signal peptidase II [Clostridiales bacterium]|nr:signal peptidase II [Clostridiales bacterium]